jgi:hypothetical protein
METAMGVSMNKIHQSQLKGLHLSLANHDALLHLSFNEWLETYVGEFKRDWWRTYNLDMRSPAYGTTWHFADEKKALLTLLKWS